MRYFIHTVLVGLTLTANSALSQDRPVMKHPFLCGQSWDASTYEGHGPNSNSLDFYYWRERGSKDDTPKENLTQGQYIVATAAGEVNLDVISPDDTNGQVRRIRITHANGWETAYFHAKVEPPFLKVGRKVAMGEVIARAGRSGTWWENSHIHYVQRDPSGTGVRQRFDGVNAKTHAGDKATWGHAFSEQAERMTSANCTAASFVRWVENGQNFILRYSPRRRQVRITRLNADGSGGENIWTGENWGRSWTHHIHWRNNAGDHFLLQYSGPRGRAQFFRINPGGAGLTLLEDTTSWSLPWTILKRVNHFGLNYIITYDSVTGYQQIRRLDEDNRSGAVTHVSDDIKGWTHILPFDSSGDQFLLYYKSATGRMQIRQLIDASEPDENGTDLRLETVWDGDRRSGWSHVTMARDGSRLYMLGFRATDGRARLWHIEAPSEGPAETSSFDLNRKWDIITSMRQNGDARILLYGIDAGHVATMDVNDDGSGLTEIHSFNWQGGWR